MVACGPDTATGLLGTKQCDCNTAVTPATYKCLACGNYPQPLGACYTPATIPPPVCPASVVAKMACTPPCSGPCTITTTTDAGKPKVEGCVCVTKGATSKWSCATQWW